MQSAARPHAVSKLYLTSSRALPPSQAFEGRPLDLQPEQPLFLTPFPTPAPVQGAPKEVVDPSSGRATLLESIRQAGGIGKAKLRSVKERKLEKKKQKEQEQGAGRTLHARGRALPTPPATTVPRVLSRQEAAPGQLTLLSPGCADGHP